jgi:hypothetical protein
VRLSTIRVGRALSPGRFLVLISVRDWVDPRAIGCNIHLRLLIMNRVPLYGLWILLKKKTMYQQVNPTYCNYTQRISIYGKTNSSHQRSTNTSLNLSSPLYIPHAVSVFMQSGDISQCSYTRHSTMTLSSQCQLQSHSFQKNSRGVCRTEPTPCRLLYPQHTIKHGALKRDQPRQKSDPPAVFL